MNSCLLKHWPVAQDLEVTDLGKQFSSKEVLPLSIVFSRSGCVYLVVSFSYNFAALGIQSSLFPSVTTYQLALLILIAGGEIRNQIVFGLVNQASS